jgi:hypothetical protein
MYLVHRAHTTVVESDAVLCGVELGQGEHRGQGQTGPSPGKMPQE